MSSAHPAFNSRREFLRTVSTAAVTAPLLRSSSSAAEPAGSRVRDRLWIWAHDAHCYDNAWGLPANGRMTPVEGAHYMGVPNIILIRYDGKPAAPFEQYAVPFKSLERVNWSITGAGGATSAEEREQVFRLADSLPNLTGVFMDDFFQVVGENPGKPHWLAADKPPFPVSLALDLPEPLALTRMELAQSDWHSGDYRSGDIRIEGFDDEAWRTLFSGALPNTGGATLEARLDGRNRKRLRILILNSPDTAGGMSCGLSGLRLWAGDREIPMAGVRLEASSSYAGHGAENLTGTREKDKAAPASLSVEQLRAIRSRLQLPGGRNLTLGVTLYTYQLTPGIRAHLEQCDVISLWTWESKDLNQLETNFGLLRSLAPGKRIRLGCYMWDFGVRKPITIERMKRQCEFGLAQLKRGQIEGMIFLATNICDLGLEAVEWTRQWIAKVGDEPVA